MAKINQIKGVQEVIRKLKENHEKIGKGIERGLLKAALRLQRESAKLVPVDTGNLKTSIFTRKVKGEGYTTVMRVGYTANYALYVHELVEMKLQGQLRPAREGKYRGHYWDPQGRAQAKFLEEPARRLAPELRKDITSEAKL